MVRTRSGKRAAEPDIDTGQHAVDEQNATVNEVNNNTFPILKLIRLDPSVVSAANRRKFFLSLFY